MHRRWQPHALEAAPPCTDWWHPPCIQVKRLLEGSEPSTRVLARQPSKLMQGMVAMVIQRQYRKKQEKKQSARTKAPQPTSSR